MFHLLYSRFRVVVHLLLEEQEVAMKHIGVLENRTEKTEILTYFFKFHGFQFSFIILKNHGFNLLRFGVFFSSCHWKYWSDQVFS